MSKNLIKQIMIKTAGEDSGFDSEELVKTINNGYTANLETKFQIKKKFIPSKLAYGEGKCPRYWYLAFNGANFEDNSTPFSIANMKSGTHGHERILGIAVQNSGIAVDVEFEVTANGKDGTMIFGGFCDGMINWKNEDYVLELKTCNNDAFEYRKRTGKAKSGHIEQLVLYMKVLKKAKGIVLYENKNTHELLAIPIYINEEYKNWANNTFEWMEVVKQAYKDQQMPIKPYRSNSKVCKSCPLKTDCYSADFGVIKIDPLEELSEIM